MDAVKKLSEISILRGEVEALTAEVKSLHTVLEAAQEPRHDYCGHDDWFINLDKAVYEATADVGERYRDKYADSRQELSDD